MKYARLIGLAAVAALAMTMLAGVGSASAAKTALCESAADSPYCASEDRYAGGTALEASAGDATISTNVGSIECSGSSLEGETGASSGEPLPVEVAAWTLSDCKLGGTTCTVTSEGSSYSASLSWTGSDDGTLAVGAGGEGAPRWGIKCGWLVNCTFSFEPDLEASGGSPAALAAGAEPMSREGGICPKTAAFSAGYAVSSPQPAHVATTQPPGTVLCEADQYPCAGANIYPEGTEIEAESSEAVIVTNISNITCDEAAIAGETTSAGGEPEAALPLELTTASLSSCVWAGIGSCAATATGAPYSGSLASIGEGAGSFLAADVGWQLKCGFFAQCTFTAPELSGELSGGDPAELSLKEVSLETKGSTCPSTATLSADYTVTEPQPVYVSEAVL